MICEELMKSSHMCHHSITVSVTCAFACKLSACYSLTDVSNVNKAGEGNAVMNLWLPIDVLRQLYAHIKLLSVYTVSVCKL